jgi:hypothetical protein
MVFQTGGEGGSVTGTFEAGVSESFPAYTFTAGDVVGMAVDYDTGEVRFWVNNSALNGGDPIFTLPDAEFDPWFGVYNQFSTFVVTVNLTAAQFTYTPPTGYSGYPEDSSSNITPADPTLDEVVSNLCQRAGLLPAQFDVTELASKQVRGMAISQVTSTRSVIEMLARAYSSDKVR